MWIKVIIDKGELVGIFIVWGKFLCVGEYLCSECGKVIKVIGVFEVVIIVSIDDWYIFLKVCYYLGNCYICL